MPDDIRIPGGRYGLDMSYEKRAEMEKDASTEAILNDAAKKAGVPEPIHFTGDDLSAMTYGETKASQGLSLAPNIDNIGTGVSALRTLAELFEVFGEATVGAAAVELGGVVLEPALAAHEVAAAWQDGDERKEALAKDMMHTALLANLSLPAGYAAAELAKRPEMLKSWQAPTQLAAEKLAQRPELKMMLQVRCDEGMHVAQQFLQSGRPLHEFLKVHPDLNQRFHVDAAFRSGFDAMVWSKEQGPQQYESTVKDLHSRDVRFHANANLVWAA